MCNNKLPPGVVIYCLRVCCTSVFVVHVTWVVLFRILIFRSLMLAWFFLRCIGEFTSSQQWTFFRLEKNLRWFLIFCIVYFYIFSISLLLFNVFLHVSLILFIKDILYCFLDIFIVFLTLISFIPNFIISPPFALS